jgi:penicillin-binding protein 1C
MNRRRYAILAAAILCLIAVWWSWFRGRAGAPTERLADHWNSGHRIVGRHGELLRELPSELGVRGRPMALEEVGDRLLLATLVSEDKRFYQHSGVDVTAVVRAAGQNARHLRIVSGASTITQQLVKLLDAGGRPKREGRTVGVKLREAARAQNLEERMSKRAILEAYLNRLNYGRNLIGPRAAAQAYFGVSPRDLSWAQAALLAVLPRAPSYLDPYDHVDRARSRQRALLEALAEQKLMSTADVARSSAEPLVLQPIAHPFEAPYLVQSLRAGRLGGLAEGNTTQTSIDLALQRVVEGVLDSHAERLRAGRASSAAVLVVDNATGEVLAYVGGRGLSDAPGSHIDMALAPRQPGSTLKPFVYARAFENGLQPSTMLADVPSRFGEQSGAYAPDNFDRTFHGPVSAREALAGSLNVPAVRLASELPDGELLALLRNVGLTSLDRDASHYGLSLALGSGEVPLIQLAKAYVSLARGGDAIPLTVRKLDEGPAGARVIAPSAAAAVADALSDPLARVRGLGGTGPFDLGYPVAVKTGTSSGYKDCWTVGYTHELTVAVWVGNPDGRTTAELTGGSGAGPVFADVMRLAMEGVDGRGPLFEDDALVTVPVCPLSGRAAGPACPESVPRRLIPTDDEASACDVHRHARHHPIRCDAHGPETIVTLDDRFVPWLAQQPVGAPGRDAHGLPWLAASAVPGCHQHVVAKLSVDDPAPGSVLLAGDAGHVELAASVVGVDGIDVEFVLDGEVVAKVGSPYRAHVPAELGDHLLVVRPADPSASVQLARSRFSVR